MTIWKREFRQFYALLKEAQKQTESIKDGQRMYRVTAVSARTLGIVLHGKALRDVWISEMLQTDEIPREPWMDNVIPPQWCRNQMERGAVKFLFFYTSMNTHTTRRKTHTHSLHTPVSVMRYTALQGEIHLVYAVKILWFFSPFYIYFLTCSKFSLCYKNFKNKFPFLDSLKSLHNIPVVLLYA